MNIFVVLVLIMKLSGKNYFIASVQKENINNQYISWLNDKEVNKFLEIRHEKQNLASVLRYIKSFQNNQSKVLWGIFYSKMNTMIGTVNIYNINCNHETADISIMIGNKNHWGTSAAEEALILVIEYAFKKLQLRKLIASTYAINIGINFTLKKIGFSIEGKLIKNRKTSDNQYTDEFKWGLFAKDWVKN